VDERRRVTWRDALVPAALAVLGIVELAMLRTTGWVAAAGLEVAAAGVLVFRRPYPLVAAPLAAVLMIAIAYTGTRMDEPATPIMFYIVAIYSLGRYVARWGGLVALTTTLLLIFADFYFVNSADNDATDAVFVLALAIPPYVFGRVSRKLAEQSEQLKRQQALIRDQAVRDERDRIARELHDVIAHSLSAMVVQTAAAQDLVRTHPDRAAGLLDSVAETGRNALAETGRLLHLIRDDADELGLRPAPGLADVPDLVTTFRESGLAVDADLDLPVAPLPGGVDVSAYRVVQEALTNALKYADGPVRLRVASDPGRLRISCANPVGAARTNGSGLGLQGMSERVAMLGGTLTSGATSEFGFVVDVDIPLAAEGAP
jgi:signal transduction histidine kinase